MAIHLNHLKIIIIIVRNNLIQGEVYSRDNGSVPEIFYQFICKVGLFSNGRWGTKPKNLGSRLQNGFKEHIKSDSWTQH